MGFRLRRSIKIAPGVRVNLSKSGVSTTLGKPGASVNIGRKGVRGTVGIPGTGVSYSERLGAPEEASSWVGTVIVLALVLGVLWLVLH